LQNSKPQFTIDNSDQHDWRTVKSKQLIVYQAENGKEPFTEWFGDLDSKIRVRIRNRLDHVEQGHYGDYKSVGKSVYELRFFFGPGYRVYFAEDGDKIVLLLSGGDKSGQSKDIAKAQEYWKNYQAEKIIEEQKEKRDDP
jgi:putative addiction module killer protein